MSTDLNQTFTHTYIPDRNIRYLFKIQKRQKKSQLRHTPDLPVLHVYVIPSFFF